MIEKDMVTMDHLASSLFSLYIAHQREINDNWKMGRGNASLNPFKKFCGMPTLVRVLGRNLQFTTS